jgi:hypothetical protein
MEDGRLQSGYHTRPACWRSRLGFADFFKDRFGETPKPAPETGALPGKNRCGGHLKSGERRLPACGFRQLAETIRTTWAIPPNPSAWRAPLCRRPKFWDTTARPSRFKNKRKCRIALHSRSGIRRSAAAVAAAAITELCVTVVFSELWFLSIPESLRHVPLDDQLIHPKDLAVDLCLSAK